MAIRIALHHKTSYRYDRLVSLSPHEVRLRPAPHARTPILSILFKQAKTIPIAPQHENPALMESAFVKIAAELREGELVCIYPEGKITKMRHTLYGQLLHESSQTLY